MKIVIATPLYPPEIGGPATYAKLLFEGLPNMGRSDLPKIEAEVVKFSDVRHLPKVVRHYAYYRRVRRAALGADAVLALDPVSVGLSAMKAAQKAGKPFAVKIVGDYAWEQGVQRFGVTQNLDEFVQTEQKNLFVKKLQKIQKYVAQNAAKIIVPSEYLKDIVMAWGIPGEKIEVIYNAVPLEEFGGVPEEVAKLSRPVVVTAGRLVPWKNVDGVIDAVARLLSEGRPTSLIIVGDGPERAALTRRAEEKIPDHFVFTGMLSHADTLATIKQADVFVLNSSYEGLSHLLIEAALLQVPIVATNAGGNREVVTDANGMLIPVGDTHALVRALGEIKRSTTHEIDSRFTEEKMLSETAKFLHTL